MVTQGNGCRDMKRNRSLLVLCFALVKRFGIGGALHTRFEIGCTPMSGVMRSLFGGVVDPCWTKDEPSEGRGVISDSRSH
jgi:hypothetical protein